MSGFFKKLFNRITGKTEDASPTIDEARALPAPEPLPLPEPEPELQPEPEPVAEPEPVIVEAPVELAVETKKPEPAHKTKPAPKKVEVKKPVPKKPEPKKPEPKAKVKVQPKPKIEKPPVDEIAAPPTPEPDVIAAASEAVIFPEQVTVEIPEVQPQIVSAAAENRGWLSRLKDGLSKSSRTITGSITSIFTKRKLDAGMLGELEDVLIQADLGVAMAERIVKAVSAGRYDREIEPEEVKRILAVEVAKVLKPVEVPFNFGTEKPFVILVVGVNGSGKTTTIGKLGAIAKAEGFKVMFAACDTFRAAAIEQLTVWGQRIGATTVSRPTGSDSSGLAFDAMTQARDTGTDILFIDTAGRLQNKAYLMDELDKVVRVVKKQDAGAPHAVLLVLDATTGQNAIAQAEVFTKVAGVTGLIMTKLDGTARGGILVAIAEKFKLPVHAIGVGERIDDLQPFEAEAFARTIAGLEQT
ncbi:MAG: signal recognition particle-docking protein FtsY [Rhizobiales bacterium]|nr:signal recognition particle-docking protein FtsY [Hyphomicrobiales bacterium]